ncbi:MAG: DNA mismatch repair endonuclease MutL, partial [Oscillospiraceae bacterium]
MGNIHVLDKNISELIAAGEVIERPASIIKELTENSIDASCSILTIEIKDGGRTYLRVSDNGCGIEKEEVETAFLRHATSKVQLENDLDNIKTLGFRGEALASIAAVSKVLMNTKTKNSQYGTKLFLVAGETQTLEEVGCPDGTTIIVSDLFYNVPARLKFLKKDVTEANSISSIVYKLSISHPEISFKFISDGKIKLHTSGNNQLISAIHNVFGKEFADSLIKVDYHCQNISVKGYTSLTSFSRSNRNMQHFFVNNRYVKSKVCAAAIEEAYKNSIMIGKFPSCVLALQVPYDSVDVNVHPAKIEIRF